MMPYFSSHMKDNDEVIHFYIKSRDVQGLVFRQITFKKWTLNFYFENRETGTKPINANLQSSLAWNVFECLQTFIPPCF